MIKKQKLEVHKIRAVHILKVSEWTPTLQSMNPFHKTEKYLLVSALMFTVSRISWKEAFPITN